MLGETSVSHMILPRNHSAKISIPSGVCYHSAMEKTTLLCIGHRGAMGYEPENTLRSIRKALELGAPCVEVDVYFVDGHLLVIHDDRLERTTDGTGFVMEQSFKHLRTLDAGLGERIPTLDEVCETIKGKAGLNIELKGPDTAEPVAGFIAGCVAAGWDKGAFLVSSFNHQELYNLRALDARVHLGVICRFATHATLDFAESLGARAINPAQNLLDADFVRDAQAHGIKVYPYTVNEPDEIDRMQALHVDGVFTNYPDRVLALHAQPPLDVARSWQ